MGKHRADRRRPRRTESRDRRQHQEEDDIERYHAQRRRADTSFGVERGGDDRHRAGKNDIGRRNLQIGRRPGVAITIEAGREQVDDGRWEQQPDRREHAGREQHRGQ